MNLEKIRGMFPILRRTINGKPLAYLDSAASAQKPRMVSDAMQEFDEKSYANVHRGIHTLAETATEQYEEARSKVAHFIGATPEEVVFTSGTTTSLNMISRMIPLEKGDEIIVTIMEHHANFVPWQQLAKQYGCALKVIPLTPDYRLDTDKARELITPRTKVVACTHVSNVLGTINPMKELGALAHKHNAYLVVDGAQAVPHMRVDVRELDVDFYAFSGHKMYGPSGIGVLYGKKKLLKEFDPVIFGGEMVKEVTVEETTWNDLPWKHEAGTPPITQAIGIGFAVDFIQHLSYSAMQKHETEILSYALDQLRMVEGVSLIGPATTENRSGALSFTIAGVHPHDVAAYLDTQGIAVRAGHHCANPLHCALGLDASVRVSIGVYNTKDEIDRLVQALHTVRGQFR